MTLDELWEAVTLGLVSWRQTKLFIEHSVTISPDALHFLVGAVLWLMLAVLFRRPVSSWLPWLSLLALALANEVVDLWTEQWGDPGMQYGESAGDVLLTMLLPTVLMVAVRRYPRLFARPPAPVVAEGPGEEEESAAGEEPETS